jgi:4-hydroxybenzoate polyprenyltransferase/phosphoserine phosphatase
MPQYPLCVDLDGTLVRTDTLLESLLSIVRSKPHVLAKLPFWGLRGKAYFKQRVSEVVDLNAGLLPYHAELVSYLQQEHRNGRRLVLATAAHEKIATSVARHLGFFSQVCASTAEINLSGTTKAAHLQRTIGAGLGYSYIGNSSQDLPVWSIAKEAIVVNAPLHVLSKAQASATVVKTFPRRHTHFAAFLRAIRPHQWIKNILIFLPIVAGHQLTDYSLLLRSFIAFVAFCCASSSAYLFNDLGDLEADRQHESKRLRPFACGDLPLSYGFVGVPLLLLLGLLSSGMISWQVCAGVAGYFLLTLAYSLYLKQVVLLDVIVLSLLYGSRIYAGSLASGIEVSTWLLIFSIFLFFSLALAKRAGEIYLNRRRAKLTLPGRSYIVGDLRFISSIGVASGYLSVLIFALYINSESVKKLYVYPQLLWPICVVLLYWISHIWLQVHRGKMLADPIVFAFKDRISYAVAAITTLLLAAAWGIY